MTEIDYLTICHCICNDRSCRPIWISISLRLSSRSPRTSASRGPPNGCCRSQSAVRFRSSGWRRRSAAAARPHTPRTVALTPQGGIRQRRAASDRIERRGHRAIGRSGGRRLRGWRMPEDFATSHLPRVLAIGFAEAYPAVALEVTCDLTLNLARASSARGACDMVLPAASRPRPLQASSVWREPFVWAAWAAPLGRKRRRRRFASSVLALRPVYRSGRIAALDRRRRWRIAYTCCVGRVAGRRARWLCHGPAARWSRRALRPSMAACCRRSTTPRSRCRPAARRSGRGCCAIISRGLWNRCQASKSSEEAGAGSSQGLAQSGTWGAFRFGRNRRALARHPAMQAQ